jgi:hypothetical protein
MKKLMILLAVAALPSASGCCCARLCPFCPCNWFNRPATYCAPACPAPTYAAPLAATCAPACAPYSPCAPVATASPFMPAMAQAFAPQCATCQAQPMMTQAQPMMTQAQPMYYQAPMPNACGMQNPCGACYGEPGCSYGGEAGCGCGGPSMSGFSGDCGSCEGSSSCGSGGCGGDGCSSCNGGGAPAATAPTPAPGTPDRFVDPAPGA